MTTKNDIVVKNQFGEESVEAIISESVAMADKLPAKSGVQSTAAIATVDLVVESIADLIVLATPAANVQGIGYVQIDVQSIATLANALEVQTNLNIALINDLKAKYNLNVAMTNAIKAEVNAILAALKVVV